MRATHNTNCTASCAPVLYLALGLRASNWKLAFTVGLGQKPRADKASRADRVSGIDVGHTDARKLFFGFGRLFPGHIESNSSRDGFPESSFPSAIKKRHGDEISREPPRSGPDLVIDDDPPLGQGLRGVGPAFRLSGGGGGQSRSGPGANASRGGRDRPDESGCARCRDGSAKGAEGATHSPGLITV